MDAYEAPSVVEFNARPSDHPSDRQKPLLISIVVCTLYPYKLYFNFYNPFLVLSSSKLKNKFVLFEL